MTKHRSRSLKTFVRGISFDQFQRYFDGLSTDRPPSAWAFLNEEAMEQFLTDPDNAEASGAVLDRVVAVKVINQPVADDPQYLDALQREARLAAGLDHPNITTVYDFQVEDGTAYIVMEYVPDALDRHLQDGTMAHRLANLAPLDDSTQA